MKQILAIAAFAFAFSMNGFAQEAQEASADQAAPKCEKKCADCKCDKSCSSKKGKKCCKKDAAQKDEAPKAEEKAAA